MAIINQTASIDDLYNRFDALRQQPNMPPVMSQGIGPLFMNQGGSIEGTIADAIGMGLSIGDVLGALGKFSGISTPYTVGKTIFNLFTGRPLLPFGIGSLFGGDDGDPRGLTEAAKTGAARITPVTDRQSLGAPEGGDYFGGGGAESYGDIGGFEGGADIL
tara:strand:- start:18564 stop:19046 length:483 start_codon:yes stop_codon:yes gene_type:complete